MEVPGSRADLKKLTGYLRKCGIILHEIRLLNEEMMDDSPFRHQLYSLVSYCLRCEERISLIGEDFHNARDFINGPYFKALKKMKKLFSIIVLPGMDNIFTLEKWKSRDKTTLFFANYILLNQNYRLLKESISEHFVDAYRAGYELVCDPTSPLFDITEMRSREEPSDMSRIRIITDLVVKDLPVLNAMREEDRTVLEEQVAEIIKNAIRHGNKGDLRKKIHLWYNADSKKFRIICEDEGHGFKNFDEWNRFNRKRNDALKTGNFEEMVKFIQYKGPDSTAEDGGNALFAAIEYWDSSLVYNAKKNKVAALKYLTLDDTQKNAGQDPAPYAENP
jgi:serine/threonine-protein kinase RsbW